MLKEILHLSRYTRVRDLREIVFPLGAVHGPVCLPLDRAHLALVTQYVGEVQVPPMALIVIRIIRGLRYGDIDSESTIRALRAI